MSYDLETFMNESWKRIYLNQACGICNNSKQNDDDNIFKYCYDCDNCDKVICYLVMKDIKTMIGKN